METKAVVISGEAPESDDETINIKTGISIPSILVNNSCGTMVQGEARESDDENNSISSSSYAVDAASCTYANTKAPKSEKSYIKYNSLLHKKLRECNKSLDKDIRELISNTIVSAEEQLSDTNKQLLKSELILQDTVCKFQTSSTNFEDTLNSLLKIVEEDYFHTIKL